MDFTPDRSTELKLPPLPPTNKSEADPNASMAAPARTYKR
ncbi:Uncharacterised protein [Vibrio cholerae]|uniref:Uncharacterized protein n=1 Tax=Vibrio cholerae TaxID=666 RepID=A0A655S6X8_VIBCL|nr:Uncharacterised protein [Vibrio cholerae]CSB89226.1 Uncharacterised protein [Vibrio cholerae]CSB92119.1 Uncharacterised protein [Vibrio cholerae]CSC74293.1 Uncharacterised protein [Vibrio cholerae]CSC94337.1 Uncharacterised protein [Vibrio cholerae]